MKWFLLFIVIACVPGLDALESNMLAQQAWNVSQLSQARQRRLTATPTRSNAPRFSATPSTTPDRRTRTATNTPPPSATPTPTTVR